MKKTHILFVCLGNICRSPLAQAIFEKNISKSNLKKHFYIDSAATADYQIGKQADNTMIRIAKEHKIINHIARQINEVDIEKYDYIFAMDSNIYNDIIAICSNNYIDKVYYFRKFDPLSINNNNVPDPYLKSDKIYNEVFEIINRTCEAIFNYIVIKNNLTN